MFDKNAITEHFKQYFMSVFSVSDQEFREAFFSLKINKNPRYDNISFNVVIHCFDILLKPLKQIFSLSLSHGIFSGTTKNCKNNTNLQNWGKYYYWPISVLTCFMNELCTINYRNMLKKAKYFIINFVFKKSNSTDYAIIELVNEVTKY